MDQFYYFAILDHNLKKKKKKNYVGRRKIYDFGLVKDNFGYLPTPTGYSILNLYFESICLIYLI